MQFIMKLDYITKYIERAVTRVMTQKRSRSDRDTPVRTPARSLDDMDGRGWEVRGWVANG